MVDDKTNPNDLGNVSAGRKLNVEITRQTLKKQLPNWMRHAHENIDAIKRKAEKKGVPLSYYSIEALRAEFAFLPVLVVGYGNSFHETVDMLKEIPRDKCKIISCDRPLAKLVENGVIPDLVVNLDSGCDNIKPFYFKDKVTGKSISLTESERLRMKIAIALTADPRHFQWFHGKKYWYVPSITAWENNLTEELYQSTRFPKVATAGNVGTTSIVLSKMLGCKPINIVGIDFGRREFNGLDKPATSEHINTTKHNEIAIKNADGSITYTDTILKAYAMATRDMLVIYDLDVRNLGGGLLHGKWIKTYKPSPDEGGSSRERMQNFIDYIKKWEVPKQDVALRELFKSSKRMCLVRGGKDVRRDADGTVYFPDCAFCPTQRVFEPHETELIALRREIDLAQAACRNLRVNEKVQIDGKDPNLIVQTKDIKAESLT